MNKLALVGSVSRLNELHSPEEVKRFPEVGDTRARDQSEVNRSASGGQNGQKQKQQPVEEKKQIIKNLNGREWFPLNQTANNSEIHSLNSDYFYYFICCNLSV